MGRGLRWWRCDEGYAARRWSRAVLLAVVADRRRRSRRAASHPTTLRGDAPQRRTLAACDRRRASPSTPRRPRPPSPSPTPPSPTPRPAASPRRHPPPRRGRVDRRSRRRLWLPIGSWSGSAWVQLARQRTAGRDPGCPRPSRLLHRRPRRREPARRGRLASTRRATGPQACFDGGSGSGRRRRATRASRFRLLGPRRGRRLGDPAAPGQRSRARGRRVPPDRRRRSPTRPERRRHRRIGRPGRARRPRRRRDRGGRSSPSSTTRVNSFGSAGDYSLVYLRAPADRRIGRRHSRVLVVRACRPAARRAARRSWITPAS